MAVDGWPVVVLGVIMADVLVNMRPGRGRCSAQERRNEQNCQDAVQRLESMETRRSGQLSAGSGAILRPMTRLASLVAVFTLTVISIAAASRHEVTYKGTVVSTDEKKVVVTVVNEKTKKPESMTFKHDSDTKMLRGDRVVTYAQAQIVKNEKIAVTVDHDLDEGFAIVIRVDAKK
jgi:hypothetical protein